MNDEEIKDEIRKFALQNAFEHDGKTQDKIILSKILGTKPEFRSKAKEIIPEIGPIVGEVNNLTIEQQKKEIEENFPEILTKEKRRSFCPSFRPSFSRCPVRSTPNLHRTTPHHAASRCLANGAQSESTSVRNSFALLSRYCSMVPW